jgi:hypothetical protein
MRSKNSVAFGDEFIIPEELLLTSYDKVKTIIFETFLRSSTILPASA